MKIVKIPKSVTKIGQIAFGYSNITDVMIYNPQMVFEGDVLPGNQLHSPYLTVHGYRSSTAEVFAKKYGYTFKPFGSDPEVPIDPVDPTDPKEPAEPTDPKEPAEPTDPKDLTYKPSDSNKFEDSVVLLGEPVDSDDSDQGIYVSIGDSGKPNVEVLAKADNELPMTATPYYTLITSRFITN